MLRVNEKNTAQAIPSYRPRKSSKPVIKVAPRPLKSKPKAQDKAKMNDFDFVGIAG